MRLPHLEKARRGKVRQVRQNQCPNAAAPPLPPFRGGEVRQGRWSGKGQVRQMTQLPRTAKEAKAQGSPRYFSGVPCKRGHIAERFTANLTCTLCHNRGCPEKRRSTRRAYRFRQRFGADISIKHDLIEKQDGRCAICLAPAETLVLDHCHATGRIREALCNACNIALGLAGDDPGRLRSMADYIERHRNTGA